MTGANNPSTRAGVSDQPWGQRGTASVSFASALKFADVTVQLDGHTILDKLTFDLRPGEVVCLLGESGSGKSTVLRVAAGLQSISSGEVRVNDVLMSAQNVHVPPQKRGVGLMFQDFALFPHMTLLQNTMFGLSDLPKKDAMQRATAALKRVGLDHRCDDYPHTLSGGQQQRLALARSIAPRPGILMLDEPFSSLDARLRETVRTEALAILRETRATTLIVTHDPEEAMVLADRIALLRNGKIIQIDDGARLYESPVDLGAARFLSPLAEISAIVQSGKAQTPLGTVEAPGRSDGAEVIVAIRPTGALTLGKIGEGVPGRVVAKRKALGTDLLEVAVAGIDAPIHIRRASDPALTRGLDVSLRLNPEHVLVFDPN
ncbi:MAG: ABC transporter ATP-binding protein [Hyphomicrobiaceae bacterium]|nr:ABC transporter ATP-binding protein [Hyphomicrobiaceae bacterium]MCC0024559.1 ABC transporter ATP-binding protein [Hyphomicrobiaceae bacterium]